MIRYFTRLLRNENFRAADNVWGEKATQAIVDAEREAIGAERHRQGLRERGLMALEASPAASDLSSSAASRGNEPSGAGNEPSGAGDGRPGGMSGLLRGISAAILTTLARDLLPQWRRTVVFDLALVHQRSLGEALALQLARERLTIRAHMAAKLDRDPFHRTMMLLRAKISTMNVEWVDQCAGAVRLFQSKHNLLSSLGGLYDAGARHTLSGIVEERARACGVSLVEAIAFRALLDAEHLERSTLAIYADERAGRGATLQEERASEMALTRYYQDTIVGPLATLRDERELRAAIGLDEDEERAAAAMQFEDECALCVGPQRAYALDAAQARLRAGAADKATPDPALRQARRAAQRAALDAIGAAGAGGANGEPSPARRDDAAAVMLQRWLRARLWTSRAARTDDAIYAALAVSDSLLQEAHCAVDVRDRCERVVRCAVLVQKLFRGHRARAPFAARMVVAVAARDRRRMEAAAQRAQAEAEVSARRAAEKRMAAAREEAMDNAAVAAALSAAAAAAAARHAAAEDELWAEGEDEEAGDEYEL